MEDFVSTIVIFKNYQEANRESLVKMLLKLIFVVTSYFVNEPTYSLKNFPSTQT